MLSRGSGSGFCCRLGSCTCVWFSWRGISLGGPAEAVQDAKIGGLFLEVRVPGASCTFPAGAAIDPGVLGGSLS